jgi:hypothetical protein
MARARNIKPAFFQNETLSELPPLARLLFIGLWTIADYKGCLEFRPKRIKVQLLPYDECDISALVINLEDSGFISSYSVAGQNYIEIHNFTRHQNPHKNEREAGSVIPENPRITPKNKKSRLIAINPEQDGTARADSLLPLPDSLIKKEQSRNPDKPHLLPPDFELTNEMRKYAEDHGVGARVNSIFEDFVDFWQNIATKHNKRTAKGWASTWQRRIRDLSQSAPATNNTASKTDIMSPDYEMPYTRNDFDSAAAVYFDIHDDGTQEKYEQFKKNWLGTVSGKGHAHEIEAYESGYKFRERFSETRQQAA